VWIFTLVLNLKAYEEAGEDNDEELLDADANHIDMQASHDFIVGEIVA
jgi:hypothetical protein